MTDQIDGSQLLITDTEDLFVEIGIRIKKTVRFPLLVPAAPDAFYGEFGRVVIFADAGILVVHAIGVRLPQSRVGKILTVVPHRAPLLLPFLPSIFELAHQLLLRVY